MIEGWTLALWIGLFLVGAVSAGAIFAVIAMHERATVRVAKRFPRYLIDAEGGERKCKAWVEEGARQSLALRAKIVRCEVRDDETPGFVWIEVEAAIPATRSASGNESGGGAHTASSREGNRESEDRTSYSGSPGTWFTSSTDTRTRT